MKIEKRTLGALEMCYAVSACELNAAGMLFFASEGEGPCVAFSGRDFTRRQVVWNRPGGAMSLIPIPGTDGDLLAIQRFYPVFQSAEAEIVWMRHEGDSWKRHPIAHLPYVHRIGLLRAHGGTILVASTLCGKKRFVEDWSVPGAVYSAILPNSPIQIDLKPAPQSLFKNHGLCAIRSRQGDSCLIAAQDGVFHLKFWVEDGEVRMENRQLLSEPASEAVFVDLDGCGEEEMAVIESFHGEHLSIYKKAGGAWRKFYRHPGKLEFLHALWGGELNGIPSLLVGHRGGDADLLVLGFDKGEIKQTVIDRGTGPSNLAVLHMPEGDIVAAANGGTGTMDIYAWH